MNVSLTPELERLIAAKVKSGMYGSSSEVIRAALRVLQQVEANQAAQLEALRRDIGVGIEQADRAEFIDGSDVFDELLKRRTAKQAAQRGPRSKGRSSKKAAS
jgi:antitoxin ParD1/3/4